MDPPTGKQKIMDASTMQVSAPWDCHRCACASCQKRKQAIATVKELVRETTQGLSVCLAQAPRFSSVCKETLSRMCQNQYLGTQIIVVQSISDAFERA